MMKKKVIILSVLVLVMVGYFGIKGINSYNDLKTYQKQVADIKISNVNISNVPDGTYTGRYEVLWVAAEVMVTVNNHKITSISLVKHKNGRGGPAEIIPNKVIDAQTLDVDIVSGATSSSKVILKAIENALNGANSGKASTEAGSKLELIEEITHNPTPEEVLEQDPDADIFLYKDAVAENAINIDWVQKLKLTKGEVILEITSHYNKGIDFRNGMATKLPIGTKVYSAKERNEVLLVEKDGKLLKYLMLLEG